MNKSELKLVDLDLNCQVCLFRMKNYMLEEMKKAGQCSQEKK